MRPSRVGTPGRLPRRRRLTTFVVTQVAPEVWRWRMDDFEREIARRAAAAAEKYDRKLYGQDRRRQQARKALAEVRRQFVRAALHSESRLRVQYLDASESDRAVGYALVWAECPPKRELCIRLDEASS